MDLALPRPDADRDRHVAEGARIERQHTLAKRRADEGPLEVERRDEDLADRTRVVELVRDVFTERCDAPRRTADAEEGDVEPIPQIDDGAHASMRLEGAFRLGVVEQTGRHQAMRLGAERVGDAPERVAVRAGRPVPAGQRHDGRARPG